MYPDDVSLLRSPRTGKALTITSVSERADDGEIIEGSLSCGEESYPISNGIPRFVEDVSYNASWDYKWKVLDAGNAYNYRIIDKNDRAYSIHDIFDRNSHGGLAYKRATGGIALDLGCGIGQYAVKLALEFNPEKIIAVDLTTGVDLFRKILLERYAYLQKKILIVQASAFNLPFAPDSFDFVMSLGVLMHTGATLKALDNVCKLVKANGEINVWLYGSEPLAYDAIEDGREGAMTITSADTFLKNQRWPMFWIHRFRRWPHSRSVLLIRILSSDFVYRLSRRARWQWVNRIFPQVDYSEFGYRMINHYDGYINNWCDTWSEHELFPTLRNNSIAILGMSDWRLGIWGKKIPSFYPIPEGQRGSS